MPSDHAPYSIVSSHKGGGELSQARIVNIPDSEEISLD